MSTHQGNSSFTSLSDENNHHLSQRDGVSLMHTLLHEGEVLCDEDSSQKRSNSSPAWFSFAKVKRNGKVVAGICRDLNCHARISTENGISSLQRHAQAHDKREALREITRAQVSSQIVFPESELKAAMLDFFIKLIMKSFLLFNR